MYDSLASQYLRFLLSRKQLSLFCRTTATTYSYLHQVASGKVSPSYSLIRQLMPYIEPNAWFAAPDATATFEPFEPKSAQPAAPEGTARGRRSVAAMLPPDPASDYEARANTAEDLMGLGSESS